MRVHRSRTRTGWLVTTVGLFICLAMVASPFLGVLGLLDPPTVAAQTEAPPTETEVPPTATDVPLPPTEVPPTATDVPLPPTEIPPTATEVPLPPTEVPPPPTEIPPTATMVPPTATTAPTIAPTPTMTPSPTATVTPPAPRSLVCATQTLTFKPSADAFVYQANPTLASGFSPELRVRQSQTQEYESYLTFDVTGTNGGISKAELTVTAAGYGGANTSSAPDVRIVTSPWSEGSVTWDTRPSYGSIVASGGGVWGVASPYTWDVTTAVTANGTVMLALIANSSDAATANSRDQASGGGPVLTVTFGCGGSGITPTAAPVETPTPTPEPPTPTATMIPSPTATTVPSPTLTPTLGPTISPATPSPTATVTATAPAEEPVAAACSAQTFSFVANADTFVNESSPAINYGAGAEVRVRFQQGRSAEAYLMFGVSGLTDPVTSATLQLMTANYTGVETASAPDVRTVTGSWTEGATTWETKPATGALVAQGGSPWGMASTYTWDVTSAVTGNGAVSLALIGNTSDQVTANSREQYSTGTAGKPTLIVTTCAGVSPTATAVPPTATVGPTLEPTGTSIPSPTATIAATTPPPVTPTTVACTSSTNSFVANADAFVNESSPTTNYGTGAEIRVRSLSGKTAESYLAFGVSGLTSPVTSATLRLMTANYSGANTGSAPDAVVVPGTWSESSITWNTKPAYGAIVAQGRTAWGVNASYTWDVTSAVSGNGTISLALVGNTSDQVSANSREQNSAGSAGKPTLIVTTCGSIISNPTPTPTITPTPTATGTVTPVPSDVAVMVAVGDIACKAGSAPTATSCQQQATSDVAVQAGPDTVLVLGDNQYECGSAADFSASYGPSWGQLKNVTSPVIGNHEYNWGDGVNPPCAGTAMPSGAQGYWNYFGDAATPLQPGCRNNCLGYYSYDVGAWHVVVLNSMLCTGAIGGGSQCYVGSPQQKWLASDLEGRSNQCVIAAWHHPLFSTGEKAPGTKPLWDTLYAGGAEIVLAGHLHRYEQFGPQDGAGNSTSFGMRQFIVGTGGRNFQKWSGRTAPNLEVVNDNSFGVLRLTLRGGGYDWQFLSAGGGQLSASGSDNCHGAPGAMTHTQSIASVSAPVDPVADLTGVQQPRRLVRRSYRAADLWLDRQGVNKGEQRRRLGNAARGHGRGWSAPRRGSEGKGARRTSGLP